jgi:hypothetical protein
MSLLDQWRIVEMPDYTDDYPEMMQPACIRFEDQGSREFAFGCVTGQIFADEANFIARREIVR